MSLLTRRNWALETMVGKALSIHTGAALAFAPQSKVPVYTSFLRMKWMPFLDQSLPAGQGLSISLLEVRSG